MSGWLAAALIALPVLAVLAAAATAWITYRLGYESGQQAARARHALQRLEEARRARAAPWRAYPA